MIRTTRPGPPDDRLHRKFEVRLAEDHACQTGVYLRRWRVETPWFSVRLHHWLHSDDNRNTHDHPWNFYTFILKGSYLDVPIPAGPGTVDAFGNEALVGQRVKAGHIYYRPATHAHWVHLDQGEVWTLVLTGPKIRRWGFWIGDRWKRSFKYFYEYGTHPCD